MLGSTKNSSLLQFETFVHVIFIVCGRDRGTFTNVCFYLDWNKSIAAFRHALKSGYFPEIFQRGKCLSACVSPRLKCLQNVQVRQCQNTIYLRIKYLTYMWKLLRKTTTKENEYILIVLWTRPTRAIFCCDQRKKCTASILWISCLKRTHELFHVFSVTYIKKINPSIWAWVKLRVIPCETCAPQWK